MNLFLLRTYNPTGTNGTLYHNSSLLYHTIELPWLNNLRLRSCIPEGVYRLQKRVSSKYGEHLLVCDVPNRSLILVHPANYAVKELKGCIAPVTNLSAAGRGWHSKKAMQRLMQKVEEAQSRGEEVHLTITSIRTL